MTMVLESWRQASKPGQSDLQSQEREAMGENIRPPCATVLLSTGTDPTLIRGYSLHHHCAISPWPAVRPSSDAPLHRPCALAFLQFLKVVNLYKTVFVLTLSSLFFKSVCLNISITFRKFLCSTRHRSSLENMK